MRLIKFRGKYYVEWRDAGKQVRRSLRTADRDRAEQRLADFKKQAERPTISVREIVGAYLAEKSDAASFDIMTYTQKPVLGFFGALRPDQIGRRECRAYSDGRRSEGKQNGTIIKELSFLRAALRWSNPNTPAIIVLPPAPAPRDRYLIRQEYEALVKGAATPHVSLFIQLALATGGRKSAILELKWAGVDFEQRRINLGDGPSRNKGRAIVPMTSIIEEVLLEARKAALTDFVIEHGGKPLSDIRKGFAAAVRRAGLSADVTPHVLRHTAAVWMAEKDVPMPQIAAYLGHVDSRITERVYARYQPEFLRRAAAALE